MLAICERFSDALSGRESLITDDSIEDTVRVALCDTFERDDEVQRLYRCALSEAGVDLETTCWDRVRLRIQPSGAPVDEVSAAKTAYGKYSCTLPLHRDTWGSNVMSQINWWAPLLPLDPGATLEVFPQLFLEPVPNNSKNWDFNELRARRRAGEGYPQVPSSYSTPIKPRRLYNNVVDPASYRSYGDCCCCLHRCRSQQASSKRS